jgi:hypothetical protein
LGSSPYLSEAYLFLENNTNGKNVFSYSRYYGFFIVGAIAASISLEIFIETSNF